MKVTRVILGSPGCGKTSRCLDLIGEELGAGTLPTRIAFVAFTKAAAREAKTRLWGQHGLGEIQTRWVRTIHSAALGLLGVPRENVMGDGWWRQFGERHGYVFSPQSHTPYQCQWGLADRASSDPLRSAHDWGRNCLIPSGEVASRYPGSNVSPDQLRVYIERLDRFKDEHQLVDFCGLLESVLDQGLSPEVDVVFVDEAQDLAPLQIAVVESWCKNVEKVFVAGDDDQALFSFQGADADWLGTLAGENKTEVLERSFRVPELAHSLAQRVIRQNQGRVAKQYLPAQVPGSLRRLPLNVALKVAGASRSAFVLVRNRKFIRSIAGEFLRQGVAYIVEGRGGASPLSDEKVVRAAEAVHRLLKFEKDLRAIDLHALLSCVPSKSGLFPHGTKARVRKALKANGVFSATTMRDDLGLRPLIQEARKGRSPIAVLTRLPASTREYLQQVIVKGRLPEPRVVVTTMHGSKGRERDLVVVVPDMTKKTYRAYRSGLRQEAELENRVFYVAVTRTCNDLIIAEPTTRKAYEFPSLVVAGAGR